jgi:hypothetical protein
MKRIELLARCQAGEVLCHTRFANDVGSISDRWWLERSGVPVRPDQANWLLERLVPNGDGLFGDSQTWRVKKAASNP